MKLPHESLRELEAILSARDSVLVTQSHTGLEVAYKFPKQPSHFGRVKLWIGAPRNEDVERPVFYIQSMAAACYPTLQSFETETNLDWQEVLNLALAHIRVWEDVLVPPPEPSFSMILADSILKGTIGRESLIACVKAHIFRAAQDGKKCSHWQDYGDLHQVFSTPMELAILLDVHVSFERDDKQPTICYWYFQW